MARVGLSIVPPDSWSLSFPHPTERHLYMAPPPSNPAKAADSGFVPNPYEPEVSLGDFVDAYQKSQQLPVVGGLEGARNVLTEPSEVKKLNESNL